MKILTLLLITLFLNNCSKSDKKATSNQTVTQTESQKIVNYESSINFVFDQQLGDKNIAYQVEETNYPVDQLLRASKSLIRLVEENKNFWVVSAYMQGMLERAKTKAKVTIQFPFSQGDIDVEELVTNKGLTPDSEIEVNFSEKENVLSLVKINGKEFSEVDLSKNNLDHARSLQKIFNLVMKEIETRVSRNIISKTAQEKKQDFNQFVAENSDVSDSVTEEDIEAFAKENSIPKKDLSEKTKKTIRDIISSKKKSAVLVKIASKILADKPVKVAFYRPYIKVSKVALPEGTPTRGDGNVNVTLISNFLCKRCTKTEQKLVELFQGRSDKISLSYLFKIRPEERISKFAAEASLCVHKMDQSKFWEFHEEVLNNDFDGSEKKIRDWIQAKGLSTEELTKCFSSRESNKVLLDQLEATKAIKTLTLPIVMINGKIFENPSTILPIQNLIDHEFANHSPERGREGKNSRGWLHWIKSLFK